MHSAARMNQNISSLIALYRDSRNELLYFLWMVDNSRLNFWIWLFYFILFMYNNWSNYLGHKNNLFKKDENMNFTYWLHMHASDLPGVYHAGSIAGGSNQMSNCPKLPARGASSKVGCHLIHQHSDGMEPRRERNGNRNTIIQRFLEDRSGPFSI